MEALLFGQELYNDMVYGQKNQQEIEGFIVSQVLKKGLDERTAKAYQMDLEHLYLWLSEHGIDISQEKAAEKYLEYLVKERKLKVSTVIRKYRVLGYYLEYLSGKKELQNYYKIRQLVLEEQKEDADHILSKSEVDSFFYAMDREYENLDNGFRRRVCLRDSVIMRLLFYHGIEISELLRLEMSDYNAQKTLLMIRGKRERNRTVYLFSRTLKEQMAQWLSEHESFEHDEWYQNYMFLSKLGKPLSMKMIINIFDKYRGLAGIEKECKPKDLKKSLERYAKELMMEQM